MLSSHFVDKSLVIHWTTTKGSGIIPPMKFAVLFLSALILATLSGVVWVFRKHKVSPSDYNHRDYTGPDPSEYSEYQQDLDEDSGKSPRKGNK